MKGDVSQYDMHVFIVQVYHGTYAHIQMYNYKNYIYVYIYTHFCNSVSARVMDGHRSRVFGLVFHPHDSHVLISAGWDDTVQVCVCT